MPRLSGAAPPPATPQPVVERRVQIAAGLQAALLLGRGEERGLRFAMLSMEGPARSFWAAIICLPAFVVIRLLTLELVTGPRMLAELIGFSLGWVVFPLAALPLAEASGRGPLWPLLVAGWNWANIAQYAVLVVALILEQILPSPLSGAVSLISFGYAVWIEWFVAKAALRITGPRAAIFVAIDLAIGLTIALTAARVGRG
ncbi:hypothetical protein [Muricoccus radiodurans]|uniref:hypothetical protein n=1 Tax=Muricoccus radiodurans TaxID=2231721 RepID=UPI003CFA9E78